MVDRTIELVTRQKLIRYITFEGEVSTSDTITLNDFSLISNAALFKLSDGSSVTYTKATNVITVTTTSLTDEKIFGVAIGVPA